MPLSSPKALIVAYHPSSALPEPHRSLTVVPLIADQRYYGEAPVWARPVSGEKSRI
jgi:hypothetical protein